jgi:Xaa-Pro aminopeptidase
MTEQQLYQVRIALIQTFLRENNYDGILLTKIDNFAAATGGKRSFIYLFSDTGSGSLFITKEGKVYFVGNTIEEPRFLAEELGTLGVESRNFLWFDDSAANVVKGEFTGTLVSDDGSLGENVNGKLAYIRALLTTEELERYRKLGAIAADSMSATLDAITSGMAEADIAARLFAEGTKRHVNVPISLIAADDRIAKFRHPLPTVAPLTCGSLEPVAVKGYVMVVGCFVREGLVVSITRFKRVGDIAAEIPGAFAHICAVDARMQEASKPGNTLGDVFAECQQAYKDHGFRDNEWHFHHQGGATGYAGRTCKGSPGETFPILQDGWSAKVNDIAGIDVQFGHAFAWNPSGIGVKSEDTFILNPDGSTEIVTPTPHLPQIDLAAVLGRETDVVKSGIAE